MTLLLTVFAAVASTLVWYMSPKAREIKIFCVWLVCITFCCLKKYVHSLTLRYFLI